VQAAGELTVVFELKPSHIDESQPGIRATEREEVSDEGGDGDGVDAWLGLCITGDRSSTIPSNARKGRSRIRGSFNPT